MLSSHKHLELANQTLIHFFVLLALLAHFASQRPVNKDRQHVHDDGKQLTKHHIHNTRHSYQLPLHVHSVRFNAHYLHSFRRTQQQRQHRMAVNKNIVISKCFTFPINDISAFNSPHSTSALLHETFPLPRHSHVAHQGSSSQALHCSSVHDTPSIKSAEL